MTFFHKKDLLRRALENGDPEGWKLILSVLRKAAVATYRRKERDRSEVLDDVQDAALKVVAANYRRKGRDAALRVDDHERHIRQIGYETATTNRRKALRNRARLEYSLDALSDDRDDFSDSNYNPETAIMVRESAMEVFRSMANLTKVSRESLVLFSMDITPEELAEQAGVKASTARIRIQRARAKLKFLVSSADSENAKSKTSLDVYFALSTGRVTGVNDLRVGIGPLWQSVLQGSVPHVDVVAITPGSGVHPLRHRVETPGTVSFGLSPRRPGTLNIEVLILYLNEPVYRWHARARVVQDEKVGFVLMLEAGHD